MKELILICTAVFLVSCAPIRWEVRPSPEDIGLTTMERSQIVETGTIGKRSGSGLVSESDFWYYSWTERLQFMKPPVTVYSAQPISHGVFREKWKNVLLVVRDGEGRLITLGEVGLEVKTGDVLKTAKE